MITKICIKNVPPYKNESTIETDKKVNLIYGLNGTGKSTISNILFDIENEKQINGVSIEYEKGLETKDSYEFIVYNQKFVQECFYESSEIKGIFSLSKDNAQAQSAIDNANNKIKELEDHLKEKKEEETKLIKQGESNQTNVHNKVWEIKSKYSGTGQPLDYCLNGLKGDKSKLFAYLTQTEKSQEQPQRSIAEITKDASELHRSDAEELLEIKNINIEVKDIELHSIFLKIIVGNENSTIAGLIKELNNSDWVRHGRDFLHSSSDGTIQKCPFCQQNTITSDFVKEIETFFSGEYEKDLTLLKLLLDQYNTQFSQIQKSEEFDRYPILQPMKTEYDQALSSLLATMRQNIQYIEEKIEKPSITIFLVDTQERINKLKEVIDNANKLIQIYNNKIKQKSKALDEIKKEFWSLIRWEYDSILTEYNQNKLSNQQKLNTIRKDIDLYQKKINEQKDIIVTNQSKTINIEEAIEHINNALLDMGISDFRIDRYSDSLYKLSREGQTNDVFKSLSEGEKMIISLLYFIERCKGKESKNDGERRKIVVIDDPISSLSHIYVYNVGRLIIQEFTDANKVNKNTSKYDQVFLLTHSLYFFYEMAIIKRKDKEDDYNQKLFRIQKSQQGSQILEMKYSEIQNDYHAYWMIVKDSGTHPALIANCMRNIIEYFFAFVEKKDLNNIFNNKELQAPRFRAFNRYINRESHSLGQNIFDIKEFNYDDFKEAFKLVFELTGYGDHYNRMIK